MSNFRAGVALVVRREDGCILVCERSDHPGSWQLPQGGVDHDEDPRSAAWRELAEETGLDAAAVRLVSELPEWITYEWPPDLVGRDKFGADTIGQCQKWFLFGVIDADVPVRVDRREFRDHRWIDPHELLQLVVDWRRDAYGRAFSRLLP